MTTFTSTLVQRELSLFFVGKQFFSATGTGPSFHKKEVILERPPRAPAKTTSHSWA